MHKLNVLRPEQIQQYKEQGFLVVDCPFAREDYESILSLAHKNVDFSNADGVRLSKLDPRYTIVDSSEVMLKLLEHPYVLAIVSDLFGSDDYRIFLANFNNRTPNIKPIIHWHTDYQDTQRSIGPRVEVAWYLTPTNKENGCLRLIPGSHTGPATSSVRELAIAARNQERSLWRSYEVHHPREIALPLGPEKLLFRDGFIWHCTYKNTTEEIRYLYSISYCSLNEPLMLVDYELFLPRHIVEFPSPTQKRLFSLEEYRANLIDRFKKPVCSLSECLGYEEDRKWRASEFYKDGEDIRYTNF